MRSLLLAIEFLTVLPLRKIGVLRRVMEGNGAIDMARTLPWFPLVGALLGGALIGLDWLLTLIIALPVRTVGLLAGIALATGFLHLDGFVDCCDGLLGTRTVERRLEILRDSRVGAYGASGVALLILAQFVALSSLPLWLRGTTFISALLLGRWGMVFAVICFPYARSGGAGSPFRGHGVHLILASLLALTLLMATTLTLPLHRLSAAALAGGLALTAILVAWLWTAWASRRLGGGLTGDTYGALNELIVLAVLIMAPPLGLFAAHLA